MEEILSGQMKDGDDFYKLLGCDELSSTEQINAEFKVMALEVHPDKNPGDPTAARRFAELQRARDVLTDNRRRHEYDFWRRSGVAIPYDMWISMKDAMHTSMHWAVKKKKDLMLEEDRERNPDSHGTSETDAQSTRTETHTVTHPSNYGSSRPFLPAGWAREPASDIQRRFRTYNI